MDFNHSEDRRMLSDSLSRYLREQYPHEHRMQSSATDIGFSEKSYLELCELGIAGALLPESSGGFGGSGFDIAVVFEELGRGLVVEPFLPSAVLCGNILCDTGSSEQTVLDGLIDGSTQAALANYESGNRYALNRVTTTAKLEGKNWVLNGTKSQVLNGGTADYLIVSARTDGAEDSESGISLFLIDATETGITINAYPTVDGYRSADVTLSAVTVPESALLGQPGEGYPVLEKAIARGVVALCAESIGAMEVCKEMTVEYLQTPQAIWRTDWQVSGFTASHG